MGEYSVVLDGPPKISSERHTFYFRMATPYLIDEHPELATIGSLEFIKPPGQTWAQCADRFRVAVMDWLADYEEGQQLHNTVSAWLAEQEWHT